MTAALYVSVLLVVLYVLGGQSTTSDDSHCTYTFKVPAADCSQTLEDQVLKSSVIGLQAQIKLLTKEIATMKAGSAGGSVRQVFNLKQCSKRKLPTEYAEYGVVWTCGFVKKHDETVLRVVWNGALGLVHIGSGDSCRRWFFTLNDNECTEPKTIDTQLYIRNRISNILRPAYVEGYCRGITAGHVNVAWNVGDCRPQGGRKVGNSRTGWGATARIIVEELDIDDAVHVIT